jgi:dissimilatory sulfite reductase (desulfoviridin) alpha/beta subunit
MTKWIYDNNEFGTDDIGDYYGFIYRITNLINGHDYVGRKYFKTKKKLKPLKGRVNKRIKVVETDWQDYWGSSKRLLEDIEELGIENFKREIICLCKARGETNYMEAKIQFDEDVLLREDNYNGIIAIKIGIGSVKNLDIIE